MREEDRREEEEEEKEEKEEERKMASFLLVCLSVWLSVYFCPGMASQIVAIQSSSPVDKWKSLEKHILNTQ